MDINASITAKVAQFEDLKKQIIEINNQIGALQEQGRALHQAALEVRGGINALAQLKADEMDVAEKAKAKAALILPDKTLVAPDGKTPIAKSVEAPAAEVAPVAEAAAVEAPKAETPAAPTLEVVK